MKAYDPGTKLKVPFSQVKLIFQSQLQVINMVSKITSTKLFLRMIHGKDSNKCFHVWILPINYLLSLMLPNYTQLYFTNAIPGE